MLERVLVADDEELMRDFLIDTLKKENFEVVGVANGKDVIKFVKESTYDVVITDMKMPDLTGMEVLKKVKEISPDTIVIIITGFGSIDNAVEAMKWGAFHYLVKPFSPNTLLTILEKAKEHRSLISENQYLRQEARPTTGKRVIAESEVMKKILQDAMRIAKSNASVFISGESGTGKEVVSQMIHAHSLRSEKPFIKINCAAIPETLIESEFFGHEKGSFTGATQRKLGRFELANGGTILLDEISEIPLTVQAKLLRAVQEQEFERIGGTKPIRVDLRFISTSNRNIQEMIQKQVLREDLFYRLNVVPIFLPPLRERKEDILPLSEYFIERACLENHKEMKTLTKEAKKKLLEYRWPGNVRELANVIERAVVMDLSNQVGPEELFLMDTATKQHMTLNELEKRHIIETLHANQNNQTKTAEVLGISRRALQSKLKEYELAE